MVEKEKSFLGKGIRFPVRADDLYGKFEESRYEENIQQSIRLILMTSKGERVMRPDFGCDLRKYSFETMDYTTRSRVEEEVRDALTRWEPRITEIEATVSEETQGLLEIHVSYLVRSTNNPYNLVFPFQYTEGYGMGAEQ